MYLLCMSHVYAFSMQMYFFSHILTIVNCFGTFQIVSFSLPLLLVTLVVFMAPKRKSTPAWNPLRSGASSSSDHAPLSLRFHNDDALKAFLENFSWRGIHSEHWVILLTPTFPLPFTIGNASLFVTSPSLVVSCWFRSSTLTCMGLIVPYLISLLVSEVFLFLSHPSLLQMCLGFLG